MTARTSAALLEAHVPSLANPAYTIAHLEKIVQLKA